MVKWFGSPRVHGDKQEMEILLQKIVEELEVRVIICVGHHAEEPKGFRTRKKLCCAVAFYITKASFRRREMKG